MSALPAPYFRELRQLMNATFNLEDIQLLCSDLGVDYEQLAGNTKRVKVDSLIRRLAQQGRLASLLAILQEERPAMTWPDMPDPAQQIEDEQALIPDSERQQSLQDFIEKVTQLMLSEGLARGRAHLQSRMALQAYVYSYFPRFDKPRLGTAIRILGEYEVAHLVKFEGIDLSGEELNGINLRNTNLTNANLSGCNLSAANFERATLDNVNFSHSNLRGASFKSVNSKRVNLHATNLAGAIFANCQLSHADLSEAELRMAYFNQAAFLDSSFQGASMKGCDLSGVRFIRVNLSEVDLSTYTQEKAIVFFDSDRDREFGLGSITKLKGAKFREVDMTKSTITLEQLALIELFGKTILPNGRVYDEKRPLAEQLD